MPNPHLILASGSPRRRELLGRLGVPFLVDPAGVDERAPQPGEDPAGYALALARDKARTAAQRHPSSIILAADTVVTIDGIILGKPQGEKHALEMLQRLRGQCHHVVTAITIRCGAGEQCDMVRSEVCMHPVSDQEIRDYISTGEPMDKAGSYAVQGRGGRLVSSVTGCYNNVVGLPLCLTTQLLVGCGLHLDLPDEVDVHIQTGELDKRTV
jgi:septum formation protein